MDLLSRILEARPDLDGLERVSSSDGSASSYTASSKCAVLLLALKSRKATSLARYPVVVAIAISLGALRRICT